MGAILFAMGCMGRKLRRDGVLNVARKVPLVLLKDGKGGQEVFIWDWEGEKGKATIMLMWPSSQRMDCSKNILLQCRWRLVSCTNAIKDS